MTGSRKPLKMWSVTLSANAKPLPEPSRLCDIFTEFAAHWMFQIERGGKSGKLHVQGRILLEEAQMTHTMIHCFECRGFAAHDITFLPESNKSIEQGGLSFYVMKDDTRVEGPWYDPSYNPKKRKVYEGKDLECMRTPLMWQSNVLNKCSEPCLDDRCVNWVVNLDGCAGKSKLMKFMRFDKKFNMARIPMGSAIQIKTSVIQKGPHDIYMVDLPRVRGGDERIAEVFSAIEEVKNGWVESPMYGKSEDLMMDPPHVWVFSNEYPNLAHCSLDRWKIWELRGTPNDEEQQMFRVLTPREVQDRVAEQIEAAKKRRTQDS